MRRLLLACLVALPLAAIPSQARAWGGGCSSGDCDGGHHFLTGRLHSGGHQWFNKGGWFGGGHESDAGKHTVPQAGPWYLYWPYQAHFQTPAPLPFPYYSPTQVLPPNFQGGAAGMQPAGFTQPSPPPYWQSH